MKESGNIWASDQGPPVERARLEHHLVTISQLGPTKISIEKETLDKLTEKYPALLSGEVWGSVTLGYVEKTITMEDFTAFQPSMGVLDLERFKNGREQFNTLEWINLLVTSCGIQPSVLETPDLPLEVDATYETGRDERDRPILAPVWRALMRHDEELDAFIPVIDEEGHDIYFHAPDVRRKLLFLARLLPLCMNNYHLTEMGPKQTGKSHLLQSLSTRVYLVTGGVITMPQLFYSMAAGRERPGVLGQFDVCIFDEIGSTKLGAGGAQISAALKDYMQSNSIKRGGKTLPSNCGVVFMGKIKIAANRLGMNADHKFQEATGENRSTINHG